MHHETELRRRSPHGHLMSLRSRLGKAAVIGRRAYGLDPETRKAAIKMVVRIAQKARQNALPVKPPSREARVKIRWTDELIGRLMIEAPRSAHDVELAERLGLPYYCRGAMRAARSRYGLLRSGKSRAPRNRQPSEAQQIP